MFVGQEKLMALWQHVEAFIENQKITCPETISQSDRVVENSYEFIEQCCNIVGYHEEEEEEEEE